MSDLMLIKSTTFNGVHFDCYAKAEQQDKSDFWATREQIGSLLEYVAPDVAIRKIHMRNKERLDRFSTSIKLVRVEGGREVEREVTVYSFKGLLEICRYSHKPKANAVIDWLWSVADEIRRTGSYSLLRKNTVPQGMFDAAEKIILKALACKEDKEFMEVLAMDKAFTKLYGKSALDLADLSIYEQQEYVALGDYSDAPIVKYKSHFELKNSLYWERRECLAGIDRC